MNVKNIALVRATNVIPFDGIVHPISEIPYLKKEKGTAFAYAINDLLRKLNRINEDGYWTKTEEEQEEIDRQNKEILEQYLPYNSDYNSMVLWALNGLVPDDMNNTFSNKTCAIIESLEEQIDNSEIVSLVPTDTAIKGNVKLSSQAIILISKDRYESLSEEEKEQLDNLDLTVQIFDGELQKAVDETLENSGIYTAEQLSLTRADKGYFESDTKEEVIETIKDIAESHNIAQVLHWNVLTGQNDELEKLTSVKDEYKNNITVLECYQKTFFRYLFSRLDIDKNVSSNVLGYMESPVYIKALCEEIEKIGIEEYKRVVDRYNSSLENLRKRGQLPTPEQIVNLTKENKDFNLVSLIEEFEKSQENHKGDRKMDEYLKKLQEKYGYNNEITEALGKIIPAFIEHFGQENEQLVLDAISSCEIHMQGEKEKPEEYLSDFFPDKDIGRIPTTAVAFYDSMPIVTDEGISSKRLIYLTSKGSSDLQNEETMSTLVHEMGHLIKAYNEEYSIVNGQIQKRDGIATTVITRDEETGKYVSGEEAHTGLEEAINCYDEEKIMSIILGRHFDAHSYFHRLNEGIDPLFANQELVNIFRNAQLHGMNEHINYLGQEEFKILSDCFENLYFIVTKPIIAKRKNGGEKSIPQLLEEAKSKIVDYSNAYRDKKETNFSLEAIEQLDKEVAFDDRETGMKNLRQGVRENQEMLEIMEEKEDDPRI